MLNSFFPNSAGMMQQMASGMMQQAVGNMPPMMQMMMDPGQLEQKYRDFRTQYKGDPRADLDRMLQEGKISQQQLQQLTVMAKMLPKI